MITVQTSVVDCKPDEELAALRSPALPNYFPWSKANGAMKVSIIG
jgi:hypothetical protein